MNGTNMEVWKQRFFPEKGGPSEAMAAGSLAAGVALFIASMCMVLAVGFLAGALVLIEKMARKVMGGDGGAAETVMTAPGRAIAEIEMA